MGIEMEKKELTDEEWFEKVFVPTVSFMESFYETRKNLGGVTENHEEEVVKGEESVKGERKVVNYVRSLQAEIERLTEELDLANETIDRNNKRYEKVSIERQKALDRVDYLEDALLEKIRRNEELITAIKQAEQKAVKDTAKEICLEIVKDMPKPIKDKWLEWFKERYGVEVEL